ncbi:phosphoribosylglycinamide formyltransferase [Sulfurimonas denitrificans DSM 1251]|uniref:phosphoribosylglycinamide formyltransferase 1 n=1 Tax=Sulfurimonas denitrificans (strain ATCC 33889 / DSM 1251) TaxID=326298 RepID=Q30Q37_SULDN|nr:formyltransferase family protein [Sulfurimonas denitrificans]ABB44894.1 phosphoribosylglycinamide formyltransferase [Sulfurimonas denitrificans DSM 1251]MDD3442687.1 formyltransferase family protein [Sulfurimonas denitrificans]
MKRVAILASYNGSGFDALHVALKNGELSIEIPLVISNNSSAKVLKNAINYGIDNFVVNSKTDQNPDEKIEELLNEYQCEYLFLSGYMKKVGINISKNFKVINSHPALLPNYGGKGMYGRFVHEAVIKNSEKTSGVTIHEVNENYDEGKIILQKELILDKDESVDSLEKKIKELEQITIVEAFKNI